MSKKVLVKNEKECKSSPLPKYYLTEELKLIISQNSYLGQKGYTIPKSILPNEELNLLYDELCLIPSVDTSISGTPQPTPIPVFKENTKKIYIPRFYGIKRYGIPSKSEIGKTCEKINISFVKTLRDYQELAVNTYIDKVKKPISLNMDDEEQCGGGGILSLYTGAGKTVCAIKIISIIQRKTLIIVHKEFLMNQWIERIREFTPEAQIGRIQGATFDIEGKDIVLGMMQTLYNEDKTFDLSSFGFCIVDEVHRIGSSQYHKCLFQIQTPFWLGISATVKRKDDMEKLLYMFIGDIVYSIERKGDDYVSVRGIDYTTNDNEYNDLIVNWRGEIAYSSMISKICGYSPRSDFIVRIIENLINENKTSQILLLSHIRLMLEYIFEELNKRNISVGFYVGGMKQRDLDDTASTKQVILSTYMMSSEALDIPTLSTLVLASPKTDIIQCVGRILRKKHDTPIIVDIIDSHSTFQNQWSKRKAYYKKCNYKIQRTNKDIYISVENAMLSVNEKHNTIWKILYIPNLLGSNNKQNIEVEMNESYDNDKEIPKGKCLINL